MFINVSNHPSSNWNEEQIAAAASYGAIVDLLCPIIGPRRSDEELNALVETTCQKVKDLIATDESNISESIVMAQGESVFIYRLVRALKAEGIRVVAACSERHVTEVPQADGSSLKTSRYQFAGFREY